MFDGAAAGADEIGAHHREPSVAVDLRKVVSIRYFLAFSSRLHAGGLAILSL